MNKAGNISQEDGGVVSKIYYFNLMVSYLYSFNPFLTNSAKSFESTCTIETGLSDFHKLVVTVLNEKHERMPPKVI